MNDREIVSPAMAKDLDGRVEQANGDIRTVRHQLEDELSELEQNNAVRAEIALVLAQIEYLDAKAEQTNQPVEEKHEGLMDRIRRMFHSEE